VTCAADAEALAAVDGRESRNFHTSNLKVEQWQIVEMSIVSFGNERKIKCIRELYVYKEENECVIG